MAASNLVPGLAGGLMGSPTAGEHRGLARLVFYRAAQLSQSGDRIAPFAQLALLSQGGVASCCHLDDPTARRQLTTMANQEIEPAAELHANRTWNPISIAVALSMPRSRRMRCPECHGRVRAHREGTTGQRAHMEHYERHTGCSRGDCFDGNSRPHPRALT